MRRLRRGPLSLRYLPDADRPRVAYAVSRSAGSAVRRNRIRRRLRAAIHELEAAGALPPGAYLVGAGPEALTMPFTELRRRLQALIEQGAS